MFAPRRIQCVGRSAIFGEQEEIWSTKVSFQPLATT